MTIKKRFIVIGLMIASLALALSGCAAKPAIKKRDTGLSEAILSGKVAETMDAGEYTYILLDKDGVKTWAAIPVTKVTVGQEIKVLGGAVMPQFYSSVLNRTFEKVVFSGGLYRENKAVQAPTDQAVKQDPAAPAEPPVLAGKVMETMEGGSYTYVLLEKDGKKSWSAMPTALNPVKLGDEIELIRGIDMGVFKSPQLNRTFESVHFSAGIKGLQERREKAIAANQAAKAAQEKAATAEPAKEAAEKGVNQAAENNGSPLPQGHPTIDAAALKEAQSKAAAATAGALQAITGKVVETMDAGGYTYIRLERDGGEKIWAAVPAMETKVGDELTLAPGNTMTGFTSKSLNRTFDKIIFTGPPIPQK
uniref:Lipoprotein n=1 Tax=Geobacter sp. (strain M21) TaxID=443144 RepID=C6E3I8_GEOSM